MFNREFYYWCRDAVRGIRYWKDRNKVYAELYEHLWDRYESFLARGYSEKEAETMTLEAMGSADELAPQLAAIHKPHWAYAAIFTRFAALVLLCLCIGYGAVYCAENVLYFSNTKTFWDPYTQGGEECVVHKKPNISDSTDGYTFRVKEVALWRTYFDEPVEGEEYFDALYMQLSVTNPLPWMMESEGVRLLWAIDSEGTYYESFEAVNGKNVPRIGYMPRTSGLFTHIYDMEILDVREDIRWIELHYDRDGRDLVLHVELTGGDGV